MGGVSQAAGKSIVVEVLKQVPVLAKKLDSCSKKTEKNIENAKRILCLPARRNSAIVSSITR